MSPSQLLKISAVVMVLFGVPLLLAPNALVAAYKGAEMNGPGIYNSMLYGSILIAVAVLNWLTASRPPAEARNVVLANLVGNGLGLCVALVRQLTDPNIPAAAWLNVAIFAVFAALFAQAYLRMRAAEATQVPGGAAAG